jgi:uncharacterized protein (TIGR03435 family)
MRSAFVATIFALSVSMLSAQTPSPNTSERGQPSFEVASVKRYTGTFGIGTIRELTPRVLPGGVLRAGNTSLAELIKFAYDVTDHEIVGGPAWMRTDYFSIDARASAEVSRPQMQLMLRALLAQRFALTLHTDRRELDHFTLTLARSNGRPGPYLVSMPDDCNAKVAAAALKAMPPRERPSAVTTMEGRCVPAAALRSSVEQSVDAIVVDKTGLSGKWAWQVYYDSDRLLSHEPGVPPFAVALQDQLGLKLATSHDPVDVLVVDRADPPTEN